MANNFYKKTVSLRLSNTYLTMGNRFQTLLAHSAKELQAMDKNVAGIQL